MHLADGVLEWPVLVGGAVVAASGVALGLRTLTPAVLPWASALSAVFFVAGTVHIPIGVGSVHLVLSGLLGLWLGTAVFPALLVGLLLQAALLSFGGFAVLGVNLTLLALPAALVGVVFRPALLRLVTDAQTLTTEPPQTTASAESVMRRALWLGGSAAALSLSGSIGLAALALWFAGGQQYLALMALISLAHLPVLLADTLITALVVAALLRAAPLRCMQLLQACKS